MLQMNSAMWIGILFISFLVQITAAAPRPHFLAIFPREIPADGDTKACIHLNYLNESLHLTCTLQTKTDNITLLKEFVTDTYWHRCISFQNSTLDAAAVGEAKLTVNGKGPTYMFENTKKVYITQHLSDGTFLHTEKSVYKPNLDGKSEMLPDTDLEIKLPRAVSIMDKEFILSVCGRSTHGKPVLGTILVSVCRESQYYWNNMHSSELSKSYCKELNRTTNSSGCFSEVIDTNYFHLRTPVFEMEFKVFAKLIEDGTGQETMRSAAVPIRNVKAKVAFKDLQGDYKRGLPYRGQIYVEDLTGSPMTHTIIVLKYDNKEEMLLTDGRGEANFSLNTSTWNDDEIHISAFVRNCTSPHSSRINKLISVTCEHQEHKLIALHSKSSSYLHMHVRPIPEMECHAGLKMDVEYIITKKALEGNPETLVLSYLVMSNRRRIVLGGSIRRNISTNGGLFSFTVPRAAEPVPEGMILLYVVLPNGELIADTLEINLSACLENKVYQMDRKEATDDVHYFKKDPPPCIPPNPEQVQNRIYTQGPPRKFNELDAYKFIWDLGLHVSSDTTMRKPVPCRLYIRNQENDRLSETNGNCAGHCLSNCRPPTDWKQFHKSSYFFSSCMLNWEDSREFCVAHGADLVVINHVEEQNFIANNTAQIYWIGLTDEDEEGRWYWIDGTSHNTTFGFWCEGEPNNVTYSNPKGEDCALIWTNHACPKTWNDDSCLKNNFFICEKENHI
ncbi:alpha-2-macroglobulin-like [Protopterus annectens]|uniref:alpha-2-macroglobulin-like n=1 Tax=Protopterus annectens TaxID=7888 RepID=UPI001CFAB170|nr:alpha-2-macroglobulin-like [Protopterus annectens]